MGLSNKKNGNLHIWWVALIINCKIKQNGVPQQEFGNIAVIDEIIINPYSLC